MQANTRNVSAAGHRIFFVGPLLAAWAALLAIPAARASTIVDQVDIVDGVVDVDEDGIVGSSRDDAADVLLFFSNNAPIRVDIIDGLVDVTENGSVTVLDDLNNFDLNDLDGSTPTSNEMDIIHGFVDVDENHIINSVDDATDVKLVKLVGSLVDQVDIIDTKVDVNEDGNVYFPEDAEDDANDVLLAYSGYPPGPPRPSALVRVDIVDGRVDVDEDGQHDYFDQLVGVGLNDLVNSMPLPNQVIIGFAFPSPPYPWGLMDVNENNGFDTYDDATDVKLVKLVGSVVDHVDIIDGQVDVTQSGAISSGDDLDNVLLLFDDAAPIQVDIIDGKVDVTESGNITTFDDLPDAALTCSVGVFLDRCQVDIVNGFVDVNEDGSINEWDSRGDVLLLVP